MQLKINRLLLDQAVERVAKAIDPNPFIPVMKGILITAEDNKITLVGSNGEISIKHEIPASVDAEILIPGIFLVELSLFRNIIKKLDGDLIITSNDSTLEISTENDIYRLNLYQTNEYPEIDFNVYGDKLRIKWETLKEMSKDVIFAASNNEMNILLCCVNMSAQNHKLKFVTTDRYRYAEVVNEIEEDVEFNISILAKNLRDILGFEYSKEVTLNISDQKILFEIDGTIIQSKVVDQPYQDISRIVPKEFATELIINKKELNNLLNKASVIITENYNKIRVHILDGTLTISSAREEIANATVKTQAFTYNGEELKLALNSKFLKDAISVFEEELRILLTKDKMRIVIKSDSNPNVLQLITPQKGF
ncbi:DNA polymerase III subunit beta [Metamycoplasma neophronis]|uniref:DNA polymerase III subunit beta n=1 Tax=Metamycoplasma neophronis TaxID=872983 RepID=A0ABY2Z0S8_9BACT|nr:DNA polymerase III subunit beta [Metamycoplasma neophronis]TPR54287.1 DNA polymerase III subunit beta [Metamycoplasma neophronis]